MGTNQLAERPMAKARVDQPQQDFIQAPEHEDLTDVQLASLRKKFRTKTDLYSYLDARSKCFYF